MAKNNSKHVPTINPPNKGLMAWLNQNDKDANASPPETEAQKAPAIEPVDKPVTPDVAQEPIIAQHNEVMTNGNEPQRKETDVAVKGDEVTQTSEAAEKKAAAPTPRKQKNRGGEGLKSSEWYLETFFKKPVKPNGNSLAGDGKPIRVSEESHLLLSVLVSEARRHGYKLNIGDLIDNLLTNHRTEHKSEVDDLIAKWKTRKSFD